MTIKDRQINEVRPPLVHADKLQGVNLKAEDDCQVIFANFAFVLNKGQSQIVKFAEDGDYPFQVEYLGMGARRRPLRARTATGTVGCTVFLRASIMTMQSASGPTGDIRVP